MRRLRIQILLGTCDQVVSSGSNMVLALLVARSSSTADFGIFSLASMLIALTLGLNRTLLAEPYAVWLGSRQPFIANPKYPVALGRWAFVVGFSASVAFALAMSGLIRETLPWGISLMLIALPLVAVQDLLRYVSFAWRRSELAASSDALWLLALLCLGLIGAVFHPIPADIAMLTWAASGAAAALMLALALRAGRESNDSAPDDGEALRALVKHQGCPAATEYLALTGSLQFAFFAAASALGTDGIAGPRGALLLLGPLTILFAGVGQASFPHLVRTGRTTHADMVRMQAIFAGSAIVLVLLLLKVPLVVGQQILGVSWGPSRDLLVPAGIGSALLGVSIPMLLVIRSLGLSHVLYRWRLFVAPLYLIAGLVASQGGAHIFMWSLVVVQFIDLCCVLFTFLRHDGSIRGRGDGLDRAHDL